MTATRHELDPVITYPRDAVLTIDQVAAALHLSVAKVRKADLPTVRFGRDERYRWGKVLDYLDDKAGA